MCNTSLYYHATLPFIIMCNILNILYIMCNTSSHYYYYYYPFITLQLLPTCFSDWLNILSYLRLTVNLYICYCILLFYCLFLCCLLFYCCATPGTRIAIGINKVLSYLQVCFRLPSRPPESSHSLRNPPWTPPTSETTDPCLSYHSSPKP